MNDDIVGKRVTHSAFGRGVITSYSPGKIAVRFVGENDQRKFLFPEVFKSFMTSEDSELQNAVVQQIESREHKTAYEHELSSSIETVIHNASIYLKKSEARSVAFPYRYNDPWNQACYVARYLFAYAFEYEQLFMTIISWGLDTDRLKVLSLGCGAMTDAWSLNSALRRCRQVKSVNYTGVDKEVWNPQYVPQTDESLDIRFINTYAQSYLESVDEINFDIIVFPKSIGDIRVDGRILRAFERIRKNTFYLAVSMISYEDRSRRDDEYVELIKDRVLSCGYTIEKQIKWRGADHYITSDWNNIKHPMDPEEVERLTGRKPILKRNYENDIIIKFTRRT